MVICSVPLLLSVSLSLSLFLWLYVWSRLYVCMYVCMYLQILLSTAAHVGAECRAFTSADQGLQHFIYGSTQMLATQVSR